MRGVMICDLVKMSMGECAEWVINNQHDYELIANSAIKSNQELIVKIRGERDTCSTELNDALRDACNLKGDNAEQKERIKQLEADIELLHAAASHLKDDLIMRGEKDSQGCVVVNCGTTAWSSFKAALKSAKQDK